jgi:hypothetical protein
MTIIRFPGSAHQLPASTTADPSVRLSVGPLRFTCTACGTETAAEFHNLIFRSLEFYCLACGTPFRVTNPAFSVHAK